MSKFSRQVKKDEQARGLGKGATRKLTTDASTLDKCPECKMNLKELNEKHKKLHLDRCFGE